MIFNGPAWASEILVLGIVAVLIGFVLVVLGYRRQNQGQRRK